MDRVRLLCVILLLGAHLSLAPFTFAAPPDPVSLSGIFDGADDDDVALAEMAMTAVVPSRPMLEGGPQPCLRLELPMERIAFRIALLRAFQIRAPPTP